MAFSTALETNPCTVDKIPYYVGCVPIAMGQIMRYHQHPTNYNWSLMPSNIGNETTASFLKDIHTAAKAINSDYPDYNCSDTAISSSIITDIFKTYFSYSSAILADYDYNAVVNNLNYQRPVILGGGDHMWVCDGSRSTTYYFDDCTGITYLHFNMKWGEDPNMNDFYDGWFAFNNFNPGSSNYNSGKVMVYNIIP